MSEVDRLVRLSTELRELTEKIDKLNAFLEGEVRGLDPSERSDLQLQAKHMQHYAKYLTKRVIRTALGLHSDE
ncbi:hypothetical protein SEA_VETRIX_98 [Mycobacterium phage Vetrix]|nr:hypothetical protein SEA_VETRIX_98 [Mycobacterium phage Vetrix]